MRVRVRVRLLLLTLTLTLTRPTDEGPRSEELGSCSFSTFAEPTDDAAASRLIFAPFVRLLNSSFATPARHPIPLGYYTYPDTSTPTPQPLQA